METWTGTEELDNGLVSSSTGADDVDLNILPTLFCVCRGHLWSLIAYYPETAPLGAG